MIILEKIGLITIHDTLNFGSLLQTYSLYEAVKSLGKDITLLDYKNDAISRRECTYKFKDCRKPKEFYKAIFHHGFLEEKQRNFWSFIRNNMAVSDEFDYKSVQASNNKFDTFLVGSDIVWGMQITGSDFNYMLQFASDDKKKVAFSSSVGTRWPKDKDSKITELLSRFDSISVREQLAVKWINELLPDMNVCETCDPTMLWDKSFWNKFVERALVPSERYVLVYLKTDDKCTVKDARTYGKEHNLPVYYINYNHCESGVKNIRPTTVSQWISLFAFAEVIFTASYHGIMFSLFFEKPFFWYSRANSARTDSLSKELGIENREGNERNLILNLPINYSIINQIVAEKRKFSWERLKQIFNVEN